MIAAQINKRITTLRSARSFIDWQKRADFVSDFDLTRTTIAERVGQSRPDLALDLMWRFMELAEPVFNRVARSSRSSDARAARPGADRQECPRYRLHAIATMTRSLDARKQ